MSVRPARRARAGAVALLAAVVSLPAGCGGPSGAPDPGSASPVRPATAPPAPTTTASPPGAGTVSPPATGTSPAATPAGGTAPAGSLDVAVREQTFRRGDRRLETTIWSPDGPGPFPLILFSHGLTAHPTDYAQLLRRWARAGFVVAAPAYPHTSYQVPDFDVTDVRNQPADASYVISRLVSDRRVDPARIAAAGHSAGGITTVGMLTGDRRDRRLRAAVVMAGRQVLPGAFTGPAAPVLFVHGRKDTTVPYADGLDVFRAVPWPKAMLAVTAGIHVTTDADFELVAATTTDFWRWTLYGDAAARQRLHRDATAGGQATFDDDLG